MPRKMGRTTLDTMMDFEELESKFNFEDRPPFTITGTNIVCSICRSMFAGGSWKRLDCPRCMAVEEKGIGSKIHNFFARVAYEQ